MQSLPSGYTGKAITSAAANVVLTQKSATDGGFVVTQTVKHNPGFAKESLKHVIQSWIEIEGAANNGENWYSIGYAMFYDDPKASMYNYNWCGTSDDFKQAGYTTFAQNMYRFPCSLAGITGFVQTDGGDFTHTAIVPITDPQSYYTLLIGSQVNITTGYNSFASDKADAPVLDAFQGATTLLTLEGAVALSMTSAAAAVIALTAF